MRTFNPLLLLLFAMLGMAATCERPLDADFDFPEASLVVVSNFTNNEALEVQVSRSRPVLQSGKPEVVRDAVVRLYQGDNFLEELALVGLQEGTSLFRTRTFKPRIGILYTIEVEAPGFSRVTAENRIPPAVDILDLEVGAVSRRAIRETGRESFSYQLALTFRDPAGEPNYYHLNIRQKILQLAVQGADTTLAGSYILPLTFSTNLNNNYQVVHYDGGVLFEDTPFDGQLRTLLIPVELALEAGRELPSILYAELRTVSEAYYRFHSSLARQQLNPDIPYSEPVILYNNIRNGRGIFAGYSQRQDSTGLAPFNPG